MSKSRHDVTTLWYHINMFIIIIIIIIIILNLGRSSRGERLRTITVDGLFHMWINV